jgi:hypothetical protein
MRKYILLVLLILSLGITGCSLKAIVVNSTGLLMEDVIAAFFEEEDVQFAKEAIPANLKLLEGLIRGSNYENEDLLIKGCKLYSMNAVAFYEDASAERKQDKKNLKRAKRFYKKTS